MCHFLNENVSLKRNTRDIFKLKIFADIPYVICWEQNVTARFKNHTKNQSLFKNENESLKGLSLYIWILQSLLDNQRWSHWNVTSNPGNAMCAGFVCETASLMCFCSILCMASDRTRIVSEIECLVCKRSFILKIDSLCYSCLNLALFIFFVQLDSTDPALF